MSLIGSQCVIFQTFCLAYDPSTGICIAVHRDFYLNNGIVMSRTAATWTIFGNILSCQPGYTLIDNICVITVQNCARYDQMSGCQYCNYGFALNGTQCISDSGICLSRSGQACTECFFGYVAFNGTCFSLRNYATAWGLNGSATTAITGYQISSSGLSYSLPFNCLNQNFNSFTCVSCSNYFTLYNGFCLVADANCISYNNRGICQECSSGYSFIQGLCRSTGNCASINQNTGCVSCVSGFVLMSGVCIRGLSAGCALYDTNMNCLRCSSGYYLSGSGCTRSPVGCISVTPNGTCITCDNNYVMSNTRCISQISDCQNYNSATGLCSQCFNGYTLLQGGTCRINPQLCLRMNVITFKCDECIRGFIPIDNNSFCAMNVSYCISYNPDGSCSNCQSEYYLTQGRCSPLGRICLNYNALNQCTQCIQGYTLVSGNCIIGIPNCIEYTNSLCSRCASGYYLSNNACIALPANCLAFSPGPGCTQCVTGYRLQSGVCLFI